MRRRLTDGEREIIAECEADAREAERAWASGASAAHDVPSEAEWDERAAGYDWPAELDMDPDPEHPW
jgi:hypothetical protein